MVYFDKKANIRKGGLQTGQDHFEKQDFQQILNKFIWKNEKNKSFNHFDM